MKEYIEFQDLHELLKELAQKEYGEKYGEQVFWYFEDVIENNCKIEKLDEEIERLNNIINKALGIANERFNYYYNHKSNNEEHLEDWENIFNTLVRRDEK